MKLIKNRGGARKQRLQNSFSCQYILIVFAITLFLKITFKYKTVRFY